MATDASTSGFELILEPLASHLPLEAAKAVAAFELPANVQERLDQFAEKSTAGTLSPAEREEYASIVTALDFVAILQAQARGRVMQSA
jgi:hypothetical protein